MKEPFILAVFEDRIFELDEIGESKFSKQLIIESLIEHPDEHRIWLLLADTEDDLVSANKLLQVGKLLAPECPIIDRALAFNEYRRGNNKVSVEIICNILRKDTIDHWCEVKLDKRFFKRDVIQLLATTCGIDELSFTLYKIRGKIDESNEKESIQEVLKLMHEEFGV